MATKAPWLAQEWHPWKNGNLKPTDVLCNRHTKVWWLLPYNDPVLGHFDFEWEASPNSRMCGNGCPFLVGQSVWSGYNDLLTRYPEIACQWHPTKNGEITPKDVTFSSNKKYWWFLSYDDPQWGHFDFEWEAKVNNRTSLGEKCPFIGNDKVWVGYNDLQPRFPIIASQWHPIKNKSLTPQGVVYGSPKSVWWLYPYVDPNTGEFFEFEWQAPVNIRTGVGTNDGHQTECPYLSSNPKVWKGYNDLESRYPETSKDWHPKKNRKLKPDRVYHQSTRKVWWKCAVCGYEWFGSIRARTVDGVDCKRCLRNKSIDL